MTSVASAERIKEGIEQVMSSKLKERSHRRFRMAVCRLVSNISLSNSNSPVSLRVSEEVAGRLRLTSTDVRSFSHADLLAGIFSGSGSVSLRDAFPTLTIFQEEKEGKKVVAKFFLCSKPEDTSVPLDDIKAGILQEPVEIQLPNLDVGLNKKTR